MKIAILSLSVLFIGATNVASLPSLMSEGEIRTVRGSGCYQLKSVNCEGGDSAGCEGIPCTFHEAQGETIPAAWKCEPTNTTKEVKQGNYDTAVTATVGQTGQDGHGVPDPENPTDSSNYHQCVKKYTCSDCTAVDELELVTVINFPPVIIYTLVTRYYCGTGAEHDPATYDPELQQIQVLAGEECEVPGPGTQVEEPVIP